MTHFREHEDYTFKQHRLVGKGGNGEVYDVVLHDDVKNRYPCLAGAEVVAKKVGTINLVKYALYILNLARPFKQESHNSKKTLLISGTLFNIPL